MNSAYSDLVRARITDALAESASIAAAHRGGAGELREVLVRQLLVPLLPAYAGVTSGTIISANNRQSKPTDIIVYDKRLPPPALVGEYGMIPIEAVLYTIEVHTRLTRQELGDAHQAAVQLSDFPYLAGQFSTDGKPIAGMCTRAPSALFALGSDLEADPAAEIERYRSVYAGSYPALRAICIAGRGYWYWSNGDWRQLPSQKPQDEVLHFLVSLINMLPDIAQSRGFPHLGHYVID